MRDSGEDHSPKPAIDRASNKRKKLISRNVYQLLTSKLINLNAEENPTSVFSEW